MTPPGPTMVLFSAPLWLDVTAPRDSETVTHVPPPHALNGFWLSWALFERIQRGAARWEPDG